MGSLLASALAALLLQDAAGLAPEPDAAAQRAALKQLKDLFKEDYAKRGSAEQAALAAKLLGKGKEAADDPTSRYVLLREAAEVAAGAGDVETAFRAADEIGRSFAVDLHTLKLALATKMAGSARDAETARTLARACLSAAVEAAKADAYAPAAGILAKAEPLARTAQDTGLATRIADLKKDVVSLKDEHARVKPMLEKPGPGDHEALGRWLCFAKGDWEGGMVHLVAGAKGPLKALVDRDVADPAEVEKRTELAQAWADFAAKERSPWRRARIRLRTRHWLEKALADATGLAKLQIEKKLGELEEPEPGTVDLLRLVDPKADAIVGEWSLEGGVLVSPVGEWVQLRLPYTPPDEYDLTVVVERRQGNDTLGFGLGQGKTIFALYVDSWPSRGGMTGLDSIDGVRQEKDPNMVKGVQFTNGRPSTLLIAVRKGGVKASIDGKTLLSWTGNMNRLGPSVDWKNRDPKSPLLVGGFGSRYLFSKIVLTTVSGQGKPLR